MIIPKESRRAFKRDLATMVVSGTMTGAIGPFLAFIASDTLKASGTLVSLMYCAPWIGNSLSLLWANAAEGKSKMRFVTNTWLLARAVFIFMLFANTKLSFALIAMVGQFLGTIATPAYACIMRAIYPDAHRAKMMGYVRVAFAIAVTASTALVGPILNKYDGSYRIVFPVATCFGIAAAFIFRTIEIPDDDEMECVQERQSLIQFLRSSFAIFREDRGYAWYVITLSIYGFGNFMSFAIYPKYWDEILGMNAANVGLMGAIGSISLIVSYAAWGHYIDRRSPVRATANMILLNSALPLVYILAPNFVWVIPAAVIASAISSGGEMSYFNSILRFAKPAMETRYQGLQSCAQGLRGTFGPILGGVMYDLFRRNDYNVKGIFCISLMLILLGWSLQMYGLKRIYPEHDG